MMNSIDISREDRLLLYNYLGQGFIDKKIIIFGNEPGLAGVNDLPDMIKRIKEGEIIYSDDLFGSKEFPFQLSESFTHPTTSEFARFVSRLDLAITHNEPRFLKELSVQGNVALNEHIFKPISEKNSSLINLRPLPRPTQDTWIYSNIDKKEYNKEWNFSLKRHYISPEGIRRVQGIKKLINHPVRHQNHGIVIGVGEKENKRIFFESLFKEYNESFYKINLDSHSIYFHSTLRIILCDYFNSRNGIKLSGLKELYEFLVNRKLI